MLPPNNSTRPRRNHVAIGSGILCQLILCFKIYCILSSLHMYIFTSSKMKWSVTEATCAAGLCYLLYPCTCRTCNCVLDIHPCLSGLDYVFSTFCGVYLGSTVYLLFYCIYKKNFPKVYPRVILPGFIAGLMWSVATACWFVANKVLSEAVAFPIVSTGPGIITAILGVFVFHEIKVRGLLLISYFLIF